MSRQARIEYPGALHHVRARGNNRQAIFRDDQDRREFLVLVSEAVRRYGWLVYAWVLMTNHIHFVIETAEPNLSDGMKWLLSCYVEWFHFHHGSGGHLFGDRFHSDLIEKESYLREAAAYVVLNPVRASMVARPEDYAWSSYRAAAGLEPAPAWLALSELAPHFGSVDTWRANYQELVAAKMASGERLWDRRVNRIYLGSVQWVKEIRKRVEGDLRSDVHPRAHREVGRPDMAAVIAAVAKCFDQSEEWLRESHGGPARSLAAWIGFYEGLCSLRSIAASLRLQSSGRVSQLVSQCEGLLRDEELRSKADVVLAMLSAPASEIDATLANPAPRLVSSVDAMTW